MAETVNNYEELRLKAYRGIDFSQTFIAETRTGAEGVPVAVNITDWDFAGEIKVVNDDQDNPPLSQTPVATWTFTKVTAASGIYTISLTGAQVTAIEAPRCLFDVLKRNNDNSPYELYFRGELYIADPITEAP